MHFQVGTRLKLGVFVTNSIIPNVRGFVARYRPKMLNIGAANVRQYSCQLDLGVVSDIQSTPRSAQNRLIDC